MSRIAPIICKGMFNYCLLSLKTWLHSANQLSSAVSYCSVCPGTSWFTKGAWTPRIASHGCVHYNIYIRSFVFFFLNTMWKDLPLCVCCFNHAMCLLFICLLCLLTCLNTCALCFRAALLYKPIDRVTRSTLVLHVSMKFFKSLPHSMFAAATCVVKVTRPECRRARTPLHTTTPFVLFSSEMERAVISQ